MTPCPCCEMESSTACCTLDVVRLIALDKCIFLVLAKVMLQGQITTSTLLAQTEIGQLCLSLTVRFMGILTSGCQRVGCAVGRVLSAGTACLLDAVYVCIG